MERTFTVNIPDFADRIISRLEANGFEAFAVGGCVRDSICKKIPKDWDVCTSAKPEQIKEIFESDFTVIPTGEKHGTITVLSNHHPVEVTTFRYDGSYSDGRHPQKVQFVSHISEDLARRDFTVNAMAYNRRWGIVDLFGGMEDIKNKLIRCVGNPTERFEEDALRIMRALRFSAVCNFNIEKETSLAIHRGKELLRKISAERIYAELKKLLLSDSPSTLLIDYKDVFDVILPKTFSEKNCYLADKMPKDISMRLGVIFGNMTADAATESLEALKAERETIRRTCIFIKNSTINAPVCKTEAKYMLKSFGKADAIDILKYNSVWNSSGNAREDYFNRALIFIDEIEKNNECYSLKSLDISGSDLLSLGIRGQKIGIVLNALLDAVIENSVKNHKAELLDLSKRLLNEL